MSSQSIEDYIKAIFELGGGGAPVQTSVIADRLEVRPASVSNMMRRLAKLGLVEHEPYRGVILTDDGERLARRMLRRHRLIERFLSEYLEYPWDEVHAEAERLEHAVSQRFVGALDRLLQSPGTDPHGAPIPASDGSMEEPQYPPLSDLQVGENAIVRRVIDGDAELLRYLGEIGVRLEAELEIVDRGARGDSVTVRVGDRTSLLGLAVAGGVFVERVSG
ncbi:MAG TPA: metal-dependent transcriptional regulator [Acidobacteriota bacterium]|nr:metal-dependent transcriptional regulator [Acidobacteriota bacterium]